MLSPVFEDRDTLMPPVDRRRPFASPDDNWAASEEGGVGLSANTTETKAPLLLEVGAADGSASMGNVAPCACDAVHDARLLPSSENVEPKALLLKRARPVSSVILTVNQPSDLFPAIDHATFVLSHRVGTQVANSNSNNSMVFVGLDFLKSNSDNVSGGSSLVTSRHRSAWYEGFRIGGGQSKPSCLQLNLNF